MNNCFRVVFPEIPVSVKVIELNSEWDKLKKNNEYPPVLENIMGEALAALYLMVDDIPQKGMHRLQFSSDDMKKFLLVEVNAVGRVRGIIRWNETVLDNASFTELFADMNLSFIFVPNSPNAKSQQSLVELKGNSVAECMGYFFKASIQQQSKFYLYANNSKILGLLIQKIPDETIQGDEDYRVIKMFTDTLKKSEMQNLSAKSILDRLYHEYKPDLYRLETEPHFGCNCSTDKINNMLLSLGKKEAFEVLNEQGGEIKVICEFCNFKYLFKEKDLGKIFIKM